MLTVIMECRDQESELAQTLAVLVAGAIDGLVSDVVVLDHGSRDGTARLAEATGCRFYEQWDMKDVLSAARGEWIMIVEPGAKPQSGWIEEVSEYMALNQTPARFSVSRSHRRSLYQRIAHRPPPLEQGLLLPKREAISAAKSGSDLVHLARGQKARRLASEIVPSWVARGSRRSLA